MKYHARLSLSFGSLLLAAALIAAHPASAQLPAYEGFVYANGSQLNGLTVNGTGGLGWLTAWSATAAAIATNVSPGMAYSTLPVNGGSVIVGNPTTTTFATTASSQRLLADSLGNYAAAGSGSVWISMLYQNLTTDTDGKLGFRQANLGLFSGATANANGSANVNGGERLAVGSPNTYTAGFSDTLGLWNGSTFSSSGLATPRGSDPANTVFIVLRLDVDGTTNPDTAYAWFNPSLASEPSIGTATVFNATDLTSVNALRLQAGNSNTSGPNSVFQADELRVGLDWNSILTVVPEPSSLTLLGLGGLALWLRRRPV